MQLALIDGQFAKKVYRLPARRARATLTAGIEKRAPWHPLRSAGHRTVLLIRDQFLVDAPAEIPPTLIEGGENSSHTEIEKHLFRHNNALHFVMISSLTEERSGLTHGAVLTIVAHSRLKANVAGRNEKPSRTPLPKSFANHLNSTVTD
jgi:hypothetical protein